MRCHAHGRSRYTLSSVDDLNYLSRCAQAAERPKPEAHLVGRCIVEANRACARAFAFGLMGRNTKEMGRRKRTNGAQDHAHKHSTRKTNVQRGEREQQSSRRRRHCCTQRRHHIDRKRKVGLRHGDVTDTGSHSAAMRARAASVDRSSSVVISHWWPSAAVHGQWHRPSAQSRPTLGARQHTLRAWRGRAPSPRRRAASTHRSRPARPARLRRAGWRRSRRARPV